MPGFDRTFATKKLVLCDLDGTIYLGNRLLPGAREFLAFLERKNIPFYFLSNNSSRSKRDYAEKLSNLGIETSEEKILLSTDGVIAFLKDKNIRDLYVVGTASMRQMFEGAGLETDSPSPDCVVVGFDTELTYEKLRKAALLIQNGVEYIVTHPDLVCPTPEGFIPDAGSFVALLEKATGEKPSRIFGKPHREMVSHILKKHGVAPEEVVMIGDRIYTDMELARQIPCDFILVLTGETKREDLARLPTPPDLVVSRIGDILS